METFNEMMDSLQTKNISQMCNARGDTLTIIPNDYLDCLGLFVETLGICLENLQDDLVRRFEAGR
jgi:hypothetical protein